MRLLVQPDDGIQPLVDALNGAKKTIQILIFRFDRAEIERALVDAAGQLCGHRLELSVAVTES